MLKKSKILKKITDIGIVAVVRSETIEEGIRISKACVEELPLLYIFQLYQ